MLLSFSSLFFTHHIPTTSSLPLYLTVFGLPSLFTFFFSFFSLVLLIYILFSEKHIFWFLGNLRSYWFKWMSENIQKHWLVYWKSKICDEFNLVKSNFFCWLEKLSPRSLSAEVDGTKLVCNKSDRWSGTKTKFFLLIKTIHDL